MAVNLSPVGGVAAQFFTSTGAVLTGGKLYTYAAGTTTPQVAYTTSQGNVPWTNPIVLDAAGRVPSGGEIWITAGLTYKFVLKDANDVLIGTYDNVQSETTTNAALVTYTPSGIGAVTTTVQAKLRQYVSVKDFGAVGNGVADDTTAIQAAINAVYADGGGVVYAPEGTYMQSALLEVKDNVTLQGAGHSTIFKCLNQIPAGGAPGPAQQNQSIWMRNSTCAFDFVIDGSGFDTGGILIVDDANAKIDGVNVINGGPIGAQAFQLYKADNIQISNCSAIQCLHGMQIWECDNVQISNCTVNRAFGGIWTAASSNVTVTGCVVRNCEDVGLDFEGGYNCSFVGNVVSSCYNGELATFADGTGSGTGSVNLSWIANTVHRTSDFISRSGAQLPINTGADAGAIWISSLSPDSQGIVFSGNNILVDANAGAMWAVSDFGSSDQDVTISDNTFTSFSTTRPFGSANRLRGLKYVNNTHNFYQIIATSGLLKNPRGAIISGNVFWTNAAQTTYAVKLYTDENISSVPCTFEGNVFKGFGQYAVDHDSFNSGDRSFILANNTLTEKPEINGGLNVTFANGIPKYKNQQLLVAITDSTNPTVAVDLATGIDATRGTTYAPVVDGLLAIALGGVQRNLYKFIYTNGAVASLNGSGVSTGATASASDYATFAGSTITITKVNPATNASYLLMNLQTTF